MSHNITSLKPLFLTEEEAFALLDLALMSSAENDPTKERAMLKLTDLARRYMTIGQDASETAQATDSNPSEPEGPSLPIASLLHSLSEPAPTPERSLDSRMSQHTGRVYFGRRQHRLTAMAFVD